MSSQDSKKSRSKVTVERETADIQNLMHEIRTLDRTTAVLADNVYNLDKTVQELLHKINIATALGGTLKNFLGGK